MGSKHQPACWWRDYDEECDAFDGIVSREALITGGEHISYKNGDHVVTSSGGSKWRWTGEPFLVDMHTIPTKDKP